jgi:hypothetical protein
MSAARLARVELPDFGPPGALPPLAPAIHERRLERLPAPGSAYRLGARS